MSSRYSKSCYQDIAAILKPFNESREPCPRDITCDFVQLFIKDNERFDTTRFFKAAGVRIKHLKRITNHAKP